MKKKLSLLLLLALMLFALTGRGATVNVKVNADKTAELSTKFAFTQAEFNDYCKKANISSFQQIMIAATMKQEKIDGVTYYTYTASQKMSAKETTEYFARYDAVAAVIGNTQNASPSLDNMDESTKKQLKQYGLDNISIKDFSFLNASVTFPTAVQKANGTISADQKTVSWDVKKQNGGVCYAVFNSAKAADKKITFAGLKNGKSYKAKKNNVLSIKGNGLLTSVTVKKAGKTYLFPQSSYNKGNGYNKLNFTEKGKYTVTVKNLAGKSKTIKFTVK